MPEHNPAPWTCETVQSRENRDAYAVVKDANGKILFDTLNSDVAEIHEERDEGSVTRWDETGCINLSLAAAAPDLLAACEAALAACQENIAMWAYKNEPALLKAIDILRPAIAKAKEVRR